MSSPSTTTAQSLEVIKEIPPFDKLKPEIQSKVAELFTPMVWTEGESLFEQHALHSDLFIITSGSIGVFNGSFQTSEITKMPAALSFSTLFIEHPIASRSLRATSQSVGFRASRALLEALALQEVDFNRALMGFLASEVRYWRHHPVDVKTVHPGEEGNSRIAVFDAKSYDISYMNQFIKQYESLGLDVEFIESKLSPSTVVLARRCKIVIVFVNDNLDAFVIEKLARYGVEMIALRCAGFNNVDLESCDKYKISVARVPAYSPYAVAEHAIALMMALNRKICVASNKTKSGDFSLSNFLAGFDMFKKTVGVIGTGKIGRILVDILLGFGCNVLCYDIYQSEELKSKKNVRYVEKIDELYAQSDIISLHSPLTPQTRHMIDKDSISKMKKGVMLINTSRGALVDSQALIDGLKTGQIGFAGLDVYENESEYFFENCSDKIIKDDYLARLLAFNNVIVTSHQAFLTNEALSAIAQVTFENIKEFVSGKHMKALTNSVNSTF